MVLNLTLREAAEFCNIILRTTFLWRHRFLIAQAGKVTINYVELLKLISNRLMTNSAIGIATKFMENITETQYYVVMAHGHM
tara:strand:- start:12054 stop:12299 length:246 start_codon:yes stop_codon:yes gene_type:complete